jgi:hypothetical protein
VGFLVSDKVVINGLLVGFTLLLALTACDGNIRRKAPISAEQRVTERETISSNKGQAVSSVVHRPEGKNDDGIKKQKSRNRVLTFAAILLAGSRR